MGLFPAFLCFIGVITSSRISSEESGGFHQTEDLRYNSSALFERNDQRFDQKNEDRYKSTRKNLTRDFHAYDRKEQNRRDFISNSHAYDRDSRRELKSKRSAYDAGYQNVG